ncbi:hypothetical protein Tco_0852644 [Tanacetum coccineum]
MIQKRSKSEKGDNVDYDIANNGTNPTRNRVNTYAIRNTKLLSGIEDSHHGPSDAMHNPPQPLKVAVCSSLRLLKPKGTIESRAIKEIIHKSRTLIPITSEGYLSIHNHDGNPSRSNIKQSSTKDSILQAGNHVKEILLKVNLPDHSDEVLKIKNFKKYDYTSFQDQEKYEHVGPKVTSSQDGKRSQDDDKRLDLADDLKESQVHIQVKLKEQSQA